MSISDKLDYLVDTKQIIKSAINSKGVAINDVTPFRNYANSINLIEGGTNTPSTDEWVRPTDRPPLPFNDVENGTDLPDNTIYMLFGVKPNAPNDFAVRFYFKTNTEGWLVNWGDGSNIEEYTYGDICEHEYDYESINVIPNIDGIKWVWMKFYSINNFTNIRMDVKHSKRPAFGSTNLNIPNIYEIYMKGTKIVEWLFNSVYTQFQLLENLQWYDDNEITNFKYFLNNCYNLKKLKVYTNNGTDFSYFLNNCYSFNQLLNINTNNGTNFEYFLRNCITFNKPLNINTGNGISFNYFLYGCSSFNQSLNLNTNNGTSFNHFLSTCNTFNKPLNIDMSKSINAINFLINCITFNQPLNLNTANISNFSSFLSNCNTFNSLLSIDVSKATNFSNFLGNSFSLTNLRLLNMTSTVTSLSFNNKPFSRDGLIAIFNDLYDRSSLSAGTIIITNCYGTSELTPEQRAIAINKNWTISS